MIYLIPVLLVAQMAERQSRVHDAVERLLADKLKMRESYSLRFRFESRTPGEPRREAYTAAIWRAGNKSRADVFDRESDVAADGHELRGRHVTCRNCERENYTLVTTVLSGVPDTAVAVEYRDSRTQQLEYYVKDIDWRFLGLLNSPLGVYDRVPIAQSYRDRVAGPLLHVDEREHAGKKCLVAEIRNDKVRSAVWLGKSERHNPVLLTAEGEKGGKSIRATTDVQWQETPGKHLYPKRITHSTRLGETVLLEEVVTVFHADFDTPVDPAVFTLAGLKLNENQPIGLPDSQPGDWPLWHEGRVDPLLSSRARSLAALAEQGDPVLPTPAPAAPYPASNNTSLVVALVSGVVAVVTLVVVVVVRRRRA